MSRLLTALSMIGADDVEVPLIGPARSVSAVTGLAGITSREVVIDRSGRRGTRVMTRYRADATIVITGILGVDGDAEDTWNQFDQLAGVMADAVDADRLLKWTAGEALALQRMVRLTSLDGPLEVGPDMITYQATLRSADPNAYSQERHQSIAGPLASNLTGGYQMPFVLPVTFAAPQMVSAAFTNSGFVSTPPVFALYGYLENPRIALAPDVELVLQGEVAANDVLVIDVDQRTVTLNGTANRRNMLRSSVSSWFELPRGSGTVILMADNWSAGAYLRVLWRDARN